MTDAENDAAWASDRNRLVWLRDVPTYTREDMARAWAEGHEVCEWPHCISSHVNPYWNDPPQAVSSHASRLDTRIIPPEETKP